MFKTQTEIEVSCLDPDCEGTVVGEFEEGIGVSDCMSTCPECGHEYQLQRANWSDTPEDDIGWRIYL